MFLRYFKNFKARIKINNNIKEIDVRYFVRKLDFKMNLDLKNFEKEASSCKEIN